MNIRRVQHAEGFTIVELLIVVVVIGILAAIALVNYGNIQQRADASARQQEVLNWRRAFDAYQSVNGSYPTMPDGGYCLGSGSSNGYCRVYQYVGPYQYAEANDAPLMAQLNTVTHVTSGTRQPINNTIGPWVMYFPGNIVIQQAFHGYTAADCPSSLNYAYTDNAGLIICDISFSK